MNARIVKITELENDMREIQARLPAVHERTAYYS